MPLTSEDLPSPVPPQRRTFSLETIQLSFLLQPGRLLSAALQSQQAFLQLTSSSIEGECQAYLRAALGGVNRGAHRGSCVLPRCFLACESLRRRLGAQGVLDLGTD